MSEIIADRRALLAAGAGLAAVSASAAARAQAMSVPPVSRPIKGGAEPLPFDPATVPGLSQKLLLSHHQNNYLGAVRRLDAIRADFRALDVAKAPGYQINGLKREELIAWNSKLLHEIYFASLGGDVQADAMLGRAIERDFGSHDRWAAEFGAMGKALGGGSGWVLLTWSRRDDRLVNTWAADHTMTLADGAPLLALDMYEHAYHMDYGANAGAYVDAFMKAISWRGANAAYKSAGGF